MQLVVTPYPHNFRVPRLCLRSPNEKWEWAAALPSDDATRGKALLALYRGCIFILTVRCHKLVANRKLRSSSLVQKRLQGHFTGQWSTSSQLSVLAASPA